jgi:hypothetical protein
METHVQALLVAGIISGRLVIEGKAHGQNCTVRDYLLSTFHWLR